QRVVAALVMHDTDPPQSPSRRIAGATLAGALVAALALGAVAAYGMLSGRGDPGWRDGGAVVVERESGARFVYRDGRLYPVANHTSALLIIGSASAKTVHVPRASLADVPRGTPLGIPDAPDPLPAAERLVGAPWTLCSGLSADGQRSEERRVGKEGRSRGAREQEEKEKSKGGTQWGNSVSICGER